MPIRPVTTDTYTDSDDYLDTVRTILSDTYGDTRHRNVLVADGYGVRVHVRDGHLIVDDGLGDHRRTRRLTRSQRTVKRLVVLSRTGNLTLDAIRWCTDTGITLVCARHDGTLDLIATPDHHHDARLRRAQALATTTDVGLGIARDLITAKIDGHASNLDHLGVHPDVLTPHLRRVEAATSTVEILDAESRAAADYFTSWAGLVHVSFAGRPTRIPDHWRTFTARATPLSTSRANRKAVDPINALLNYGYALGESEARRACAALGLDPALGVLHQDKPNRDSLALDLLEPLRPIIERTVLDLITRRRFGPVDFIETPDGRCRLTETVTHPLAASMTRWALILGPIVETVAATIADSATGKIRVRTPLTNNVRVESGQSGRKSRSARRLTALAGTAQIDRYCHECGNRLTGTSLKICSQCLPAHRRRQLVKAQSRTGGDTWRQASTSKEARAKRSTSISVNRQLTLEWESHHGRVTGDQSAYRRDLLPQLQELSTSKIATALKVSTSSALRIRTGKLIPHVRHWETLKALTKPVDSDPLGRSAVHG